MDLTNDQYLRGLMISYRVKPHFEKITDVHDTDKVIGHSFKIWDTKISVTIMDRHSVPRKYKVKVEHFGKPIKAQWGLSSEDALKMVDMIVFSTINS